MCWLERQQVSRSSICYGLSCMLRTRSLDVRGSCRIRRVRRLLLGHNAGVGCWVGVGLGGVSCCYYYYYLDFTWEERNEQ